MKTYPKHLLFYFLTEKAKPFLQPMEISQKLWSSAARILENARCKQGGEMFFSSLLNVLLVHFNDSYPTLVFETFSYGNTARLFQY